MITDLVIKGKFRGKITNRKERRKKNEKNNIICTFS